MVTLQLALLPLGSYTLTVTVIFSLLATALQLIGTGTAESKTFVPHASVALTTSEKRRMGAVLCNDRTQQSTCIISRLILSYPYIYIVYNKRIILNYKCVTYVPLKVVLASGPILNGLLKHCNTGGVTSFTATLAMQYPRLPLMSSATTAT